MVIAGTGLLGRHAYFVHWGVIQLSLANLIVIALMAVVFVLALVIPFPTGHDETPREADDVERSESA